MSTQKPFLGYHCRYISKLKLYNFSNFQLSNFFPSICPPENIKDYEVQGGSTISNSPIKYVQQ